MSHPSFYILLKQTLLESCLYPTVCILFSIYINMHICLYNIGCVQNWDRDRGRGLDVGDMGM